MKTPTHCSHGLHISLASFIHAFPASSPHFWHFFGMCFMSSSSDNSIMASHPSALTNCSTHSLQSPSFLGGDMAEAIATSAKMQKRRFIVFSLSLCVFPH